MFTGPVGPVEVFFYWPKAVFGNFYWPGAIGSPLASSPDSYNNNNNNNNNKQYIYPYCVTMSMFAGRFLKNALSNTGEEKELRHFYRPLYYTRVSFVIH